jgi:hypothetical protein
MEKFKQHLILLGIPTLLWIVAFNLDRVLSKGVLGLSMIILFAAYTVFAVIVSKDKDKKDPIRIYVGIGAFCFLISILMTIK